MCASINSNLYAFLVEKMRTQSTYSRVNLVPSEKYLCSLSRLVFQTAYQLGNTDLPRPPLVSVLKKKNLRGGVLEYGKGYSLCEGNHY